MAIDTEAKRRAAFGFLLMPWAILPVADGTLDRAERASLLGGYYIDPAPSTDVQGSDPKIYLSWSDDGGETWGNEYERDIGLRGKYKQKIKWNRLGMSRDRIFRIRMSEPIPHVIVDAIMDATAESD